MVYIIATIIRKAFDNYDILIAGNLSAEEVWKHLMLLPIDYTEKAIFCDVTRSIMSKTVFKHGGEEYDKLYPEGIPTRVDI